MREAAQGGLNPISFFFDEKPVGYFELDQFPSELGSYRYMPYRGIDGTSEILRASALPLPIMLDRSLTLWLVRPASRLMLRASNSSAARGNDAYTRT
jgi:hypothetical protein